MRSEGAVAPAKKRGLLAAGILIGLAVAGLVVLYIVTHRGGSFRMSDGTSAFTIPKSFANADSGMGAGGELFVVDGGCLAVKSGGQSFFLGLPSGSHADASGRAVVTGEDTTTGGEMTYSLGETIFGAGTLDDTSDWSAYIRKTWPDVPKACIDNVTGVVRLSSTEKPSS